MHGISWPLVQKMMIDAPSYDFDDKKEDEINLTKGNADNIVNYVNSLI